MAAKKIYRHRIEITTPENERSMQYGSDLAAVTALLKGVTAEQVIEDVLVAVEAPLWLEIEKVKKLEDVEKKPGCRGFLYPRARWNLFQQSLHTVAYHVPRETEADILPHSLHYHWGMPIFCAGRKHFSIN